MTTAHLLRLPLLCIHLLLGTAAFAQAPTIEEIQQELGTQFPSYWQITGHRIIAEANRGDAVDPSWAQRQEIDLEVSVPLYQRDPNGQPLEPFDILVETTPKGTARTIFLVSTAERRSGEWSFRFDFENGIGRLGSPRDLFDGPTLVLGTEEYRQAVSTLSEAARAELQASLRAEIAELEADGRATMAEMRSEIERQQASVVAQRDALRAENAALIAEEEAALAIKLDALAEDAERRIAEAEQAAEAEVEAARAASVIFTDLATELNNRLTAEKAASDARAALYASVLAEREAFITGVLDDLASDEISRRVAAFDAALAAGDAYSRAKAIGAAFSSDDEDLKSHALGHSSVVDAPDLAAAATEAFLASNDIEGLASFLNRFDSITPSSTQVVELLIEKLSKADLATLTSSLVPIAGPSAVGELAALTEGFASVVGTVPTSLFNSWPTDARNKGLDDNGLLLSDTISGASGQTLLSHPPDRSTPSVYDVDTFGLDLALTLRSHENGNGTFAVFADGLEVYRETLDSDAFVRRIIEIPAGAAKVQVQHIPDEWNWEHLYFTEMGPALN